MADDQQEAELTFSTVPTASVPIETAVLSNSGTPEGQSASTNWSVSAFKRYFSVTTSDVVTRLRSAAVPTHKRFFELIDGPDLYGPFWVPCSVAFLCFALGNISSWIRDGADFKSDFSCLVWSLALLALFTFGVPFLVVYLDHSLLPPIVHLMALFGYSVIYLIPSSVLSVFFGFRFGFIFVLIFAFAAARSLMVKLEDGMQTIEGGSGGRKAGLIAGIAYAVIHVIVHMICFL
jgi:hypothetical protein